MLRRRLQQNSMKPYEVELKTFEYNESHKSKSDMKYKICNWFLQNCKREKLKFAEPCIFVSWNKIFIAERGYKKIETVHNTQHITIWCKRNTETLHNTIILQTAIREMQDNSKNNSAPLITGAWMPLSQSSNYKSF